MTSATDDRSATLVAASPGNAATPDNAPFFIVGSPRSGTTLLQSILVSHSRLHIPAETHFIKEVIEAGFPLGEPLSPAQVRGVVDCIVTHSRWALMEFPADEFRGAAEALHAPLLADVLNVIFAHHQRHAGKPRIGEKTPSHLEYIPQLLAIYPDARFVHLMRDGHDVSMSLAEMGWGQAYQGKEFPWSRAVHHSIAYRRQPFAGRILEIRYEDMVRALEATVRQVCGFIGEQFEPDMLDWQRSIEASVPAGERWYHQKLYQPVKPDAIAVWRRKLSTIECFLMEASLYRELEIAGYELRFRATAWRPALFATGAVMRALAPLLDRAIPALRRRNYLRRPLYI